MRTKDQILDECHKSELKTPDWDTTASLHERLTIEILIDIRDVLSTLTNVLISIRETGARLP